MGLYYEANDLRQVARILDELNSPATSEDRFTGSIEFWNDNISLGRLVSEGGESWLYEAGPKNDT